MKLSMITICFNAEEVLEKTILSVLAQSVPVYEYILIDGASTDNSYEIIKSYEKAFNEKGIKYFYLSEKDKGISDAFNKGIERATGDLIGILNADDEMMPKTCEILQEYMEKCPADIYYGNCLWIDEKKGMEYISKPKHDLNKLLYYMILIHPSTFVKKETYQECGIFNVSYRYCMDKELLYRFYKKNKKFQYVDACLTKFKAGGVSDTHTKAVFKESSRMAIENGEPWVKVKMIEYKKMVKDKTARKLKGTKIYKKWKQK